MRAHSVLRRELDTEVLRPRGLTINDFEALMHISRLRSSGYAASISSSRLMLTPSGVTRLLDGLEEAGSSRTCTARATRASPGRN